MRRALVAAACLALGCGGQSPQSNPAVPDAGAREASAVDADAEGEASDGAAPVIPLGWSVAGANILADIVALWGASDGTVYIGSDTGAVYRLEADGVTQSTAISGIAGAGWGSDGLHVYAVGASDWLTQAGKSSSGALFAYGDGAWTTVAPGPFFSVWGSSATDVYAGGPSGIAHSGDGATFSTQGSTAGVLALGGSGAGDVYATTSDPTRTILHSAGDGTWTPVFGQPSGAAWAIWSGEPGGAYVVVSPVAAGDPDAFVLHESPDGGWASESVGQPGSVLVSVWGSGAGDVYVAGWHTDSGGRTGDLFHSTGDGRWSPIELPGNIYDVTCVWGRSADDVYVGIYDVDDGPTLLHGVR